MDVINKLYSSVSSTVSQLSGVLPGNPVTREFEASEHIASMGPGLLWKIYRGYKKSTKQEASIFVFEKKQLERWNKDDRESMLDILKRGVVQLTKIRHPQVLTVQHPLEESRESLAFATEPVFASLSNVLGQSHNMPQPAPPELRDFKLFDVEIKYGLIQLAEGLAFLHSDMKLLHRNICPESVVINKQGAWKLAGFEFCALNQTPHEAKPYWSLPEYNASWHILTQPPLEFTAPETALISSHCPASDIFGLGILIYTIHSVGGKPPKMFGKDFNAFKRFSNELKQGKYPNMTCIPEGIHDYVKLMFNATPEMRPDIHDMSKVPYFEDVGVKTLSYLDSLFQWDNLQKSKFYKGLPQVIKKLPHRVNLNRILPCLIKEFVNPPMVPFVLPNVLLISENCSDKEYVKHVLPSLKTVMKIQEPVQILLIFMQKMELLLKLTPAEDVKSDVLPHLLYRALEADAQQIQELCLSILPTFANLIDYPAMKNAVLPRIKKLCLTTQFLSVRVNCLLCIGKLLDHLDKWLVLDEVLPFLGQIQSREPAVLMGILGIYKLALTHNKLGITKEVMATKVIPYLVPLCIENGLSLPQFNAMIALVKDMINRIESEHRTKLEQLNSIQQESKALDMNYQQATGPLVSAPAPLTSEMDQMFSNLGLDSFLTQSPEKKSNGFADSGSTVTSPVSSGLSFEEKQRMVKQQEQAQRLQSAPKPVAGPLKLQPKLPPPKDLTSTLMEANLSQMKPSPSTTSNNWTSPTSMTSPTSSTNWNQGTGTALNWHSSSFSSAPSVGNAMSPGFGNQTNQVWGQTQNSAQNNGNWSALDSLLPSKPTKVPMNQMSQQPLIAAPSQQTNNSNKGQTNQLSSQDIMEFLG